MKSRLEYSTGSGTFVWIDLVDPTEKDLKALAKEYHLNRHAVLDCMDPEHLPKFERFDNISFLILRYYDQECPQSADTVQELTRKVAIFFADQLLITIHRKDSEFFKKLRTRTQLPYEQNVELPSNLFFEILESAIETYHIPVDIASDQLEHIEMGIFEAQGSRPFDIKSGYFLKRRASVFKRILRSTSDILPKLAQSGVSHGHFNNVKEELEKLHFNADEMNDNVAGLLNLHLSLSAQRTNEASHRTNEVMRVLTVVSLFFLPLNFIAGIYGMNFEFMPELKWQYGYYFALLTMGVVGMSFYMWFGRKGWLKEGPELRK